jgi:hypothetical protein
MILVGSYFDLQLQLISVFHSSIVGGHSGVSVTYRRMKQFIAWKGMKYEVHVFIRSYLTCQ